MNAAAVMLAPWRCVHGSMRWIMLVMLALCSIALVIALVAGAGIDAHKALIAVSAYCFGLFYAWAFWMPSLIVLASDARKLCVPGMQRAAGTSVFVYAGLCLILPTALIVPLGAAANPDILVVGLTMCAGLVFGLMPRYIAMLIGLAPALVLAFKHHMGTVFPAFDDPRWQLAGACLLAVLIWVCVYRWRRLLAVDSLPSGWNGPMVAQLRGGFSSANAWGLGGWQNSSSLPRQVPEWAQPSADLHGTGPQRPALSLRVLLGRWYVPQTWLSRLRQLAWTLIVMGLVGVAFALVEAGHTRASLSDMRQLLPFVFPWLAMSAAIGIVAPSVVGVFQRWQPKSAELPILALLPGLGDVAHARRHLLRAVLTRPLAGQLAILLVSLLVATIWWHLDTSGMACLVAVLLTCAGFGGAVTFMILGDRQPSSAGWVALLIAGFTLTCLSVGVLMSSGGTRPWQFSGVIEHWFVAALLVYDTILLWLGWRGWRGFSQRPHPFMTNGT
jgi:hypothetical protein